MNPPVIILPSIIMHVEKRKYRTRSSDILKLQQREPSKTQNADKPMCRKRNFLIAMKLHLLRTPMTKSMTLRKRLCHFAYFSGMLYTKGGYPLSVPNSVVHQVTLNRDNIIHLTHRPRPYQSHGGVRFPRQCCTIYKQNTMRYIPWFTVGQSCCVLLWYITMFS